MKNILFLMGVYPSYGGVEKVSTVLANKFIQDGYDVTIASFEQRNPEFAEMYLSKQCHQLKLSYPVLSVRNYKILRNYILLHKVDFLINQWVVPFFATLLWKFAVKGTGCKVYSVHHNKPDTNRKIQDLDIKIHGGCNFLKPLRWGIREISRWSLAFCINSSDKYILLSPAFVPIAKDYTGVRDEKKFDALPNPVTITAPREDIRRKCKEIICVGRIEYNQKRSFRVLEIWKELELKNPDWCIVFVGDGPDRNDLERRVAEAGLKRVRITGFTDPLHYYRDASILVMTSEYEGFPLVLAESMTYGVVPMVYDSFEALHDIIDDNVNGCILPRPFDAHQFASKLDTLMNNDEQLYNMSQRAKEIARQFSVESVAGRWYDKYLK